MDENEIHRVTTIKMALVQMTSMTGWGYFRQLADNVVKISIQEALDEEDADKGQAKRMKAKAMQKGFHDLFNAVETTKAFVSPGEQEQENGLGDLELDLSQLS